MNAVQGLLWNRVMHAACYEDKIAEELTVGSTR